MKRICLIREDNAVSPIKLSIGEVVIGRGPLLKCIDKRVSRNHGLLKLSDDGNVILEAIHSSPCYYIPCGNEEKEIIHQGRRVTLQDGDRFALLPDGYCFRMVLNDDLKTENGSLTEETAAAIIHSGGVTHNDNKTLINGNKEAETEKEKMDFSGNITENGDTTLCQDLGKKTISLPACKRVLPLWMLEDNTESSTPKKTKNTQSKTKKKEMDQNAEVKKKQKQFPKEPDASRISDEEQRFTDLLENADKKDKVQESVPVTKLHSISDDEESDLDTSSHVQENTQNTKQHEVSDNEQNNASLKDEPLDDGNGSSKIANITLENQQQNASSTSVAVHTCSPDTTQQKRQQCKYGAACYRKNPQHREEFSHPGDEDFEDDKSKPECPYGLSCYRKNPLHWQSYRHTATSTKKKARRQTKKQKKDKTEYESEEDSYDEDDPFINNASSDDYQPTDSDSNSESISDGEEEDSTKRMLKEAKRFVKKK